MKERDWQKDWEMCEKASSLPWKAVLLNDFSDASYVDAGMYDLVVNRIDGRLAEAIQQQIHDDLTLVAEARSALLYWLQRVRELEHELADLRDVKARAQRHFEILSRALRMRNHPSCGEDYHKPLWDARLIARSDFVLSDCWYDGEAVAFAARVIRKILGKTKEDAE